MNWDDLRLFLDLSRSGSLSGSARRLGLDHSTVGRRIAQFEQSLGLRLFDRLPRGYALTAEGRQLLGRAEQIEEDTLAFARAAAAATSDQSEQGLSGRVTISAPPTFGSHFLAAHLGPLRRAHPALHLDLLGDIEAVRLDRREADIAVRLARPEGGHLVARRVGRMGFGLYGHRDYLAAHPQKASWEIAGYDPTLDHVSQQIWLRDILPDHPLVFRTNSQTSLYSFARAGLGLSVLPHFLIETSDGLQRIAPDLEAGDTPEPLRDLWLVAHHDIRRSPRVRAVLDHLAQIILEANDKLEGRPRAE